MRCGRAGRLPKCLYIRCTSAVASLSRGSFVFSLVFTVALIPGAMERPLPHASTYDELASSAAEFRGSGVAFVPSLVDAPTLGSLRHALGTYVQYNHAHDFPFDRGRDRFLTRVRESVQKTC
jgi:hypothetical protein